MSDESSARLKASPALPAQDEYDAICSVLMHTERGRWFLQEYARRNRSAETQVLLAAIRRIENVVRGERDRQAQQSFRSNLLEMAKAITRTRAEVAEIGTAAVSVPARPRSDAPERGGGDIFAGAERIRDIAWAMRGHGFDPSTCNQLEALAASILSASSLRDPTDRRVGKLGEVLQYLEHRIDAMLAGCGESPRGQDVDHDLLTPAVNGHDPQWADWPASDAEPSPPAREVLQLEHQAPGAPLSGRPTLPGNSAERSEPAPDAPATAAASARHTARPPRQPAADDPLARLMAMSESERIALFT
jgi:hypothetical protein